MDTGVVVLPNPDSKMGIKHMQPKMNWLYATCTAALLILHCIVSADEPRKTEVLEAPPDYIKHALRFLAAHHADGTGDQSDVLIDVGRSLLAANGLGIDLGLPESALRVQLDLPQNKGLVVTSVPETSSGAAAGLKVFDVIVQANDQDVGDAETLAKLLDAAAGTTVKIGLLRGGKPLKLDVVPTRPLVAHPVAEWVHHLRAADSVYRLGVQLAEADDTLRSHLRLASGEGLVVTEVVSDSAAAEARIQRHDVLVMLDGKRLTTVEAVNAQIQQIKDRRVELRLLRGAQELTLHTAPRKTEGGSASERLMFWELTNCQKCHDTKSGGAGWHHAAWKDYVNLNLKLSDANPHRPPDAGPPQVQIGALKNQITEMQKIISALEAQLTPVHREAKE
jgi:membrane-associated protease RseP (regulator of RpoE activity)